MAVVVERIIGYIIAEALVCQVQTIRVVDARIVRYVAEGASFQNDAAITDIGARIVTCYRIVVGTVKQVDASGLIVIYSVVNYRVVL